ncbi:hypothetical protein [Saccharopolyspora sp. NPDC049357]
MRSAVHAAAEADHAVRAQVSPPADVESATPEETAQLVLDTLGR